MVFTTKFWMKYAAVNMAIIKSTLLLNSALKHATAYNTKMKTISAVVSICDCTLMKTTDTNNSQKPFLITENNSESF